MLDHRLDIQVVTLVRVNVTVALLLELEGVSWIRLAHSLGVSLQLLEGADLVGIAVDVVLTADAEALEAGTKLRRDLLVRNDSPLRATVQSLAVFGRRDWFRRGR